MKSTKLVLAALLLLPALFAAGCGGGSSSGPGGSTPAARNYAEAITLPTGQAGALTLAVQPDNSITGTLAVAGAGTAAASLRSHMAPSPRLLAPMASGVYPVTGTLTGTTFTLTGAAFTLTGGLPGGASPVSFTLTSGTGTGAVVYTGTLATASGSNSALVGAYQLTSIANPATGQTAACPGMLAFGGNNSDNCTASELFTLNSDGFYTLTGVGALNTGTYTLVGSIFTRVGPAISNGQNGPTATYVFSVVISGNTATTTLLGTTDVTTQGQIGEVFTFTKAGTTPAFAYAGTYTGNYQGTGPTGPFSGTVALTISSAGTLTGTDNVGSHPLTGTASLNSSGKIVFSITEINSGTTDVITLTATPGGSQGSYTITGSGTDTSGQTQNLTLTEGSTTAT